MAKFSSPINGLLHRSLPSIQSIQRIQRRLRSAIHCRTRVRD